MALKKTLTGWDFCECPPCEERGNEIYPTTSDDQVIIDGLGSNLASWLNIGRDGTYYTSLYSWLQANYPNSSYTLPVATDSTLGGVIVDTTNLTISNDGVLSVDVSSLNIPSIGTATLSASGTVKLGNSTTLTSNFSDGIISGQVHDAYSYNGHVYALPLRLDAQGRAGVVVPTDLFTVNQSKAASTWTFDWSKKVTNVSIGTPTSGVETNYILLGNKDVNTANGELGYDDDGELSTSCGYPRLALVAGNGIKMTRYTNTFIPQADNYWGGNISEILITADGYEPPAATTTNLGGIKVGYTKNGDKKPVQIVTDSTSDDYLKAFVDIESVSYTAGEGIDIDDNVISIAKNTTQLWQSNALSSHYFRIPSSWLDGIKPYYVPLFKILKVDDSSSPRDFRVGQLFDIVSRLSYVYYGKYSLVYGSDTSHYAQSLLKISNVKETNATLNIEAYYKQEVIDGTQYGTVTIYRKYDDVFTKNEDTFIVNILGQNNPDYIYGAQNRYIYYCTSEFGSSDTVITHQNIINSDETPNLGTPITIVN